MTKFDIVSQAPTVLVQDFEGQNFSSPNDVTVRSDGNIYFTDPAWQVGNRPENHPQSVYRRAPNGDLSGAGVFNNRVEALDNRRPNGISLSPDESLLYVAVSDPNAILSYNLDAAGVPSASTTFINGTGSDGMAIDCAGNLYLTSNGVQIYSPSGDSLGSISVTGSTTNVAFGGPENKTLYITAGDSLYSVELNVPGFPY